MSYKTKRVQATATDGTEVTLVVPATMPSPDRCDYLRSLWTPYVRQLEDHWKGPVEATVPDSLADDVAEAMEFHGALVDRREALGDGLVYLFSEGYWAHGF